MVLNLNIAASLNLIEYVYPNVYYIRGEHIIVIRLRLPMLEIYNRLTNKVSQLAEQTNILVAS